MEDLPWDDDDQNGSTLYNYRLMSKWIQIVHIMYNHYKVTYFLSILTILLLVDPPRPSDNQEVGNLSSINAFSEESTLSGTNLHLI